MKVFISSLISGFEEYRAAARDAVRALGHEPVMAENFPSQPNSPQVACLSGLRQSALVVLLLGERYGAPQSSGLSATHEEYRDARGKRPVIAFVQEGVSRDPEQQAFTTEVQGWEGGLFRGGFSTPAQLKDGITRAIHEWALANAAGPVDEGEVLQRALAQLPETDRQMTYRPQQQRLLVSLAFGPQQNVLRPAEIEAPQLVNDVKKAALFGSHPIFDSARGTQHRLEQGALVLAQGEQSEVRDSFRLAPTGDMLFSVAFPGRDHVPVVIEEEVGERLRRALAFAGETLERIDPTQRLTHVSPAVTFEDTQSVVWRSKAEQQAQPNSYSLGGFGRADHSPVHLTPPVKPRAALALGSGPMVEDLVVLLRRMWKSD